MTGSERFWLRRAHWRLRGALTWPAFAAATVLDAALLHLLPPVRTGVDLIPAVLVATFANLFLVGLVAPWIVGRLEARRAEQGPDMAPREVLLDRAATALLVAGVAGVLAAGLAARPLVVVETEDRERATAAWSDYVEEHGSAEVLANRDNANTHRVSDGYFRICVSLNDRFRAFCGFVDTNSDPVRVTRDPDRRPNGVVFR